MRLLCPKQRYSWLPIPCVAMGSWENSLLCLCRGRVPIAQEDSTEAAAPDGAPRPSLSAAGRVPTSIVCDLDITASEHIELSFDPHAETSAANGAQTFCPAVVGDMWPAIQRCNYCREQMQPCEHQSISRLALTKNEFKRRPSRPSTMRSAHYVAPFESSLSFVGCCVRGTAGAIRTSAYLMERQSPLAASHQANRCAPVLRPAALVENCALVKYDLPNRCLWMHHRGTTGAFGDDDGDCNMLSVVPADAVLASPFHGLDLQEQLGSEAIPRLRVNEEAAVARYRIDTVQDVKAMSRSCVAVLEHDCIGLYDQRCRSLPQSRIALARSRSGEGQTVSDVVKHRLMAGPSIVPFGSQYLFATEGPCLVLYDVRHTKESVSATEVTRKRGRQADAQEDCEVSFRHNVDLFGSRGASVFAPMTIQRVGDSDSFVGKDEHDGGAMLCVLFGAQIGIMDMKSLSLGPEFGGNAFLAAYTGHHDEVGCCATVLGRHDDSESCSRLKRREASLLSVHGVSCGVGGSIAEWELTVGEAAAHLDT